MKKTKPKRTRGTDAIRRLECAVERLYDFLGDRNLVEFKGSIKHPLATAEGYESESIADRIDQVTIDIDGLTLRVMWKLNKKKKSKKNKACIQ